MLEVLFGRRENKNYGAACAGCKRSVSASACLTPEKLGYCGFGRGFAVTPWLRTEAA